MRDERGASLIVLLLALVIVALSLWLIISRTAENSVGALAGAGAPLDETKRQRTIADMQAIGRANALMKADTGSYAASLTDLEAGGYLVKVPAIDGWGSPWTYTAATGSFTLTSLGADASPGPVPPTPWIGGSHACDLIMTNGQLVQAPTAR